MDETIKRFKNLLMEEMDDSNEVCLWMSFCDTEKPKGEQFNGVIIIKCLGLAHAIKETHRLGINPGGEISSCLLDISKMKVNPKHFNVLLGENELQSYGYI